MEDVRGNSCFECEVVDGLIKINILAGKKMTKYVLCKIVICFVLILCFVETAFSGELYELSFSDKVTVDDERIVGFIINIKSRIVKKINDLPVGWNISIDNSASWHASIKGQVEVGAAALRNDDLKKNITIERVDLEGFALDVSIELIVTKDFVDEKKLTLKKDEFVMQPIQRVESK